MSCGSLTRYVTVVILSDYQCLSYVSRSGSESTSSVYMMITSPAINLFLEHNY